MSKLSKREKQSRQRLLETLNDVLAAEHSLRTALAFPRMRPYWESQGLEQLERAVTQCKGRAGQQGGRR